eukprot:Gb_07441 [translate_table: standard]
METVVKPAIHVVAIPYPGQGHINPMMQLCKKLATRPGMIITFVLTHSWHTQITINAQFRLSSNIRIAEIADVIPSESDRWANFKEFLKAVATKMEAPVEDLIEKSLNQELPPISCIIADLFLPWTVSVAKTFSVPLALLWTQPVTVYNIFFHSDLLISRGHVPFRGSDESDDSIDYIPGVPPLHPTDLPSPLQVRDLTDLTIDSVLVCFESARKADCILANSLHELEGQTVDALKRALDTPIYCVGPLIPSAYSDGSDPQDTAFGTSWRAELDCAEWLNRNPKHSVLYVSFGSLAAISSAQMEEIAMGLLESGHPFLWVLRGNGVEMLPSGFVDEIEDRGIIVPWSAQLAVLSHPSVGGFLSHCGWNSTLESICLGVPMLGFPLFMDQFPACKLVVDEWKIGLRLKRGVFGEKTVERGLIARNVKRLMNGEEGNQIRKRAENLRNVAKKAAMGGGSSFTDLDKFLQVFSKLKSPSVE